MPFRPYRPAWWLPGPHAMTLWPALLRPRPALEYRMERFEHPDGDFNDLAWVGDEAEDEAPLVVILHGLEGSIEAKYHRVIMRRIAERGGRAVMLHFRGCSGEPNRLPRAYHSGETGDLRALLVELQARFPEAPMGAFGVSLGANVLLKYLGEEGAASPLQAAMACCAPMQLAPCAARLQSGLSRIYDRYLLADLKASLRRKREVVDVLPALDESRLRTIEDFDEFVTAPLHGFADAQDYYAKSSSMPLLKQIRTPTLILQAADDPFMTPEVIPAPEDLSEHVTLELTARGGHVGYVEGPHPFAARYYLEARAEAFLAQALWP